MKEKIIKGKKVMQLTIEDMEMFEPERKHISKRLMLRFFAWFNKYVRKNDGVDPVESLKQLKEFMQRSYNIKLN